MGLVVTGPCGALGPWEFRTLDKIRPVVNETIQFYEGGRVAGLLAG